MVYNTDTSSFKLNYLLKNLNLYFFQKFILQKDTHCKYVTKNSMMFR